jgi:hypothetical protein
VAKQATDPRLWGLRLRWGDVDLDHGGPYGKWGPGWLLTLPSRYLDGYGLTLENAKKLPEAGYSFVITVDNGVSAKEPIEFLKREDRCDRHRSP